MKSTELYALLKSDLDSWFKTAGFKRAKGFLSWSRSHGGASTVVWFQASRDGWDAFAGSKFVVTFQRSVEPVPGAHPSRSERLTGLLTPTAEEEVRALQNRVIASLTPPPDTHHALHVSESVTARYRKKFEPHAAPHTARDDVWLRYAKPDHVRSWSHILLQHLPACVATVESWA